MSDRNMKDVADVHGHTVMIRLHGGMCGEWEAKLENGFVSGSTLESPTQYEQYAESVID